MAGMIDLHTHGTGRLSTRGATVKDIVLMATRFGGLGIRAFMPTVYPGSVSDMRSDLEAIAEAMQTGQTGQIGQIGQARQSAGMAKILGANLEGPFLNPEKCGALDAKSLRLPSIKLLSEITDGLSGVIKIITIAPELKGALRVIEKCASSGIKVNMGHSVANYKQGLKGKQAGATGITHLFNAMPAYHHREPGLAGLGLLDDDLFVEIIADGIHLSAETLRLIFRSKPAGRIILVSDSISGPRIINSVIQGSKTDLTNSVEYLKSIGIKASAARAAATSTPLAYMKQGV